MERWTNEGQINGVCEGLTISLLEVLPETKNCSGGAALSGYTAATRIDHDSLARAGGISM